MDFDALFGTDQAFEIAITAGAFYGYMVLLLRISGKRTTMTMTSFDFVSTVAMATIIGSTILQGTISLIEGMIAVTVLVALQWIIALASSRSPLVRNVVSSSPAMLFADGQFHQANMAAARISREQLMQKIRSAGHASPDSVQAVVLESAGSVSVIEKDKSSGNIDLKP